MIKAYTIKKPRNIFGYPKVDRYEIHANEGGYFTQKIFSKGQYIRSFSMCDMEDLMLGELKQGDIVTEKETGIKNLKVVKYIANACGDGCCQTVVVIDENGKESDGWPNDYELDLEATGITEEK